jgi:hypothetical protein
MSTLPCSEDSESFTALLGDPESITALLGDLLIGVFSFSLQHNFTNLYTTARSKKSSTSTGISKMETKLTSRQWVALLFEAIHGCLKQFMNESGSQMELISLFEIKKKLDYCKVLQQVAGAILANALFINTLLEFIERALL